MFDFNGLPIWALIVIFNARLKFIIGDYVKWARGMNLLRLDIL